MLVDACCRMFCTLIDPSHGQREFDFIETIIALILWRESSKHVLKPFGIAVSS